MMFQHTKRCLQHRRFQIMWFWRFGARRQNAHQARRQILRLFTMRFFSLVLSQFCSHPRTAGILGTHAWHVQCISGTIRGVVTSLLPRTHGLHFPWIPGVTIYVRTITYVLIHSFTYLIIPLLARCLRLSTMCCFPWCCHNFTPTHARLAFSVHSRCNHLRTYFARSDKGVVRSDKGFARQTRASLIRTSALLPMLPQFLCFHCSQCSLRSHYYSHIHLFLYWFIACNCVRCAVSCAVVQILLPVTHGEHLQCIPGAIAHVFTSSFT